MAPNRRMPCHGLYPGLPPACRESRPPTLRHRGVRPPLDQQQTDVTILVGVDVGKLPPVFGTAQPPRGLSGLLRRAGYKIPEHKAGRWMTLLFADRVDVWESREQYDRFAAEQIGPYTQEVGIPEPPQTTYYDVHNTLPHD